MNTHRFLVGLFVGGKGRRMGGVKKGLLSAPDSNESLAERTLRLCRAALPDAELVLVGDATGYEKLGLRAVADDPPGVGPIGGLRALFHEAEAVGATRVLAIACDLPRPSRSLIEELARHAPERGAVAPQLDGIWQPLFARYAVAPGLAAANAALAAGERALLRLLARLGPELVELPLAPEDAELLRDWDEPRDLSR